MPAPEPLVNSLARLEAALDRMARAAATRDPKRPDAVSTELATRLDSLIGQLRHALASAAA